MKIFVRDRLALLLAAIFICFNFCVAAYADDGDEIVDIYFAQDRSAWPDSFGTAFFRAGALWVPADSLRAMGVQLKDAPNGKGFYINVAHPAQAFNCSQLSQLVGENISIYLPALSVDEVLYFNMSGMQNLVKLDYVRDVGGVLFTPNKSPVSYVRSNFASPTTQFRGKLAMVWEHVISDNPDLAAEGNIPGLDVISPTWFNLMDAEGGVANRASFAYAEAARSKGYRIWGLASNGFNAATTSAFFKSARAMDIFAARLLIYAKLYGLDGINIDFEGMNDADRSSFVRFIARLSELLHREGLIVSVDVFIPADTKSSRSHDRGNLAKYVDYVMLMAYDEHWRTCQQAGSVASLPWVTKAVEGTLAEGVPHSKLVLGVPFYMRRWEETRTNGGVKVKSYTLTMNDAELLAAKVGAPMRWLEKEGQNYFSYTANGKTYKVWVEDDVSIEKKLTLVRKYNLAGMAGWRKGHERPAVWSIISKMLGKY